MTMSNIRFTQFFVWICFLVILTYCACAVEAQLIKTFDLSGIGIEQVDEEFPAEY